MTKCNNSTSPSLQNHFWLFKASKHTVQIVENAIFGRSRSTVDMLLALRWYHRWYVLDI